MDWLLGKNMAEESVIGTYEEPVACMNGYGSTGTTDTGINDADKNRLLGKIAIAGG